MVADRAGEGAADVAEELRLEQALGKRAAVDAEERSVGVRRGGVDGAGEELLARAALPEDTDVQVGVLDLLDQVFALDHDTADGESLHWVSTYGSVTFNVVGRELPWSGMNEAGLVIGMAAVPEAYVPADPDKETVDSLGIIRLALDEAATVDEAIDLMRNHNTTFEGQTPLNYLLADATGDAALVEYYAGEIRVLRTPNDWHHATNFLLSEFESPDGRCARYDTIAEELESTGGGLDADAALSLLERVAQPHTQWSVVYGITSRDIHVAMGQAYDQVHTFSLEMRG